jgi:hypothetical protein
LIENSTFPTFTTLPIGAGAKIEPVGGLIGVAIHRKEVTGLHVNFLVPLPNVCPSLEQTAPFFGVAAKVKVVEDKIKAIAVHTERVTALAERIRIPLSQGKDYIFQNMRGFFEINAVKIG